MSWYARRTIPAPRLDRLSTRRRIGLGRPPTAAHPALPWSARPATVPKHMTVRHRAADSDHIPVADSVRPLVHARRAHRTSGPGLTDGPVKGEETARQAARRPPGLTCHADGRRRQPHRAPRRDPVDIAAETRPRCAATASASVPQAATQLPSGRERGPGGRSTPGSPNGSSRYRRLVHYAWVPAGDTATAPWTELRLRPRTRTRTDGGQGPRSPARASEGLGSAAPGQATCRRSAECRRVLRRSASPRSSSRARERARRSAGAVSRRARRPLLRRLIASRRGEEIGMVCCTRRSRPVIPNPASNSRGVRRALRPRGGDQQSAAGHRAAWATTTATLPVGPLAPAASPLSAGLWPAYRLPPVGRSG